MDAGENARIFNCCSLSALEAQDRCFSDMSVHGLITSSSVTAASALMLEDTVLGCNDDKTLCLPVRLRRPVVC